jgi:hypothetical protein
MKAVENKNVGEMKRTLNGERLHKVEFLKLLVHAERTQWYLLAGYGSLFSLCTKGLNLSRSSALKRIVAARAAARFPEIFNLLESGRLHLSALLLLSSHLNEENHGELTIHHISQRFHFSSLRGALATKQPLALLSGLNLAC